MTLAGICLIATALAWAGIRYYYARRCEKRVAVVRTEHALTVNRLEMQLASAQADVEWERGQLQTADRTVDHQRRENNHLAEVNQRLRERRDILTADLYVFENRRHYLPTIDGNRADILDAIDNLGVGVVLSCADPIDPPIAAEARAAARAVVVPIEAGRR